MVNICLICNRNITLAKLALASCWITQKHSKSPPVTCCFVAAENSKSSCYILSISTHECPVGWFIFPLSVTLRLALLAIVLTSVAMTQTAAVLTALTFSPLCVGGHQFIHQRNILKPLPLSLTDDFRIAAFIGAEQVQVEHHVSTLSACQKETEWSRSGEAPANRVAKSGRCFRTTMQSRHCAAKHCFKKKNA